MAIILRPMHFATKKVSFMFVAPERSKPAFAVHSRHPVEVECYAVPDFQQVQHLL
jgi:hypothetical protein